jgi:hypothetical protein
MTAVEFPAKFICSADPAAATFLGRPCVTPAEASSLARPPGPEPPLGLGGPVVEPKPPEAMVRFFDGSWRLSKVIGMAAGPGRVGVPPSVGSLRADR